LSAHSRWHSSLLVLLRTAARSKEYFDWIDWCNTFFDHFDTLAKAAGVKSPKSVKGFGPHACEKVFQHYKKRPATVDAVVNLAHHVEKIGGDRRRLRKKDSVRDVAGALRTTHATQQLTTSTYHDQSPEDFLRRLQVLGENYLAFDSANSLATPISDCVDPSNDVCPHSPCVANYLFQDIASPFYEFIPAYGGNTGYDLGTALIKRPTSLLVAAISFTPTGLAAAALAVLADQDIFWTGNAEDRTDTGNVGFLLILVFTQATAEAIAETACELIPDDVEVSTSVLLHSYPPKSILITQTSTPLILPS
jgi:hypothetical protein